MADLLFAAHDPGGARCLSAIAEAAQTRGDRVQFLADGPAKEIWDGEGKATFSTPEEVTTPDLLITGTGFSAYERSLWSRYPSLAIIEAWTNFTLRFTNDEGDIVLPSAIGVIDDQSRAHLKSKPWCNVPLHIVGQPHLDVLVPRIIECRANRQASSGRVVFFSEPIEQDYGRDARGYNQYDIVDMVADKMIGHNLIIKPHPREPVEPWLEKEKTLQLAVTDEDTFTLVCDADGVLGMTTMVLLEAGLAGAPTLSLQMGRKDVSNPAVDRYIPYVTGREELGQALEIFTSSLAEAEQSKHDHLFAGAQFKALEAIDKCLG